MVRGALLLTLSIGLAAFATSFASAQESTRSYPTLYSPKPAAPTGALRARFTTLPYKGGTPNAHIMMQSAARTTIPLWNGKAKVSGQTFQYTMVGKNPAAGNSPNIPVVFVPIKIVFDDFGNASFDPTLADPTCSPNGKPSALALASPIFKPIAINGLGTDQYTSLFQRGNYFTINPNYVIDLHPVTVLPKQTVHIKGGALFQNVGACGANGLGAFNISVWDNFVTGNLIPSLSASITPKTLPIFLFYNVVLTDPQPVLADCCILGYHSAFNNPSFGGAFQTYSTADYDGSGVFTGSGDVSALSHEIAEWLADPNTINPTPPWGHIGQVSGCQSNLEVGDPLSGTTSPFTLGNMTYHVQDLAFTSWFYRARTPTTYNSLFSLFGTLKKFAKACT